MNTLCTGGGYSCTCLMPRVYQYTSKSITPYVRVYYYITADHSTDIDFPSSVAENQPEGISQLVTGRDHSLRERSQNGTISGTHTSTYHISSSKGRPQVDTALVYTPHTHIAGL